MFRRCYSRAMIASALVCLVMSGAAQAAINGFEVSDGFAVGGTWPSGWEPHASTGSTVAVTTHRPTQGSQGLELLAEIGGTAYLNYWANLPITPDTRTAVSVDLVASDYIPGSDYNFAGYGNLTIYRQDYYWAGGLIFALEDYDGYDPAQSSDFHIYFGRSSYDTRELVGYFTPGAAYRYTLTIDPTAGTCTQRLETLAGGLVAERTYANAVTNVPLMSFSGSQNPQGPAYFDRLSIGQVVPEPATLSLLALGGLVAWRRRRA